MAKDLVWFERMFEVPCEELGEGGGGGACGGAGGSSRSDQLQRALTLRTLANHVEAIHARRAAARQCETGASIDEGHGGGGA